jgi:hypothetical protein
MVRELNHFTAGALQSAITRRLSGSSGERDMSSFAERSFLHFRRIHWGARN